MGLSENGVAASSPDSVILSSCSLGSLLIFPDSLQTQAMWNTPYIYIYICGVSFREYYVIVHPMNGIFPDMLD